MYGMRVDNTHNSAYNMMNRLRQNSKEEDFIEIPEGDLNDDYDEVCDIGNNDEQKNKEKAKKK